MAKISHFQVVKFKDKSSTLAALYAKNDLTVQRMENSTATTVSANPIYPCNKLDPSKITPVCDSSAWACELVYTREGMGSWQPKQPQQHAEPRKCSSTAVAAAGRKKEITMLCQPTSMLAYRNRTLQEAGGAMELLLRSRGIQDGN